MFPTGADLASLGPLAPHAGTNCATRDVVLLHQRTSVSYSASVEGVWSKEESKTIKVAGTHRTKLYMVLRSKTVYANSDFVVAYVWMGSPGFGPRCASANIVLIVTRKYGAENEWKKKTISCGSIGTSGYDGINCAGKIKKPDWFLHTTDINAFVIAEADTGEKSHVPKPDGTGMPVAPAMILAKKVKKTGLPLTDRGMWLVLPDYPLLPGAKFTGTVYANSHGFALKLWDVWVEAQSPVTIEKATLKSAKYKLTPGPSNFNGKLLKLTAAPVATIQSPYNELRSTNSACACADGIELATITFNVASSASPTSIGNAIKFLAKGMRAAAGEKQLMKENNEGNVIPGQGVVFSSAGVKTNGFGSITIEATKEVGVMAYVASAYPQELVNFAVLGKPMAAVPITIKAVQSCHTVGTKTCFGTGTGLVAAAANSLTCTSTNTDIAKVKSATGGCQLESLTHSGATQSGDFKVKVKYRTFEAVFVAFRVWTVGTVKIYASDESLGKICSTLFQSADLYATATLSLAGTSGTTEVKDVDVTPHTVFSVQGSGSATIVGNVITGTSGGPVKISAGSFSTTKDIEVSNSGGGVAKMHAVVLTGTNKVNLGIVGSRTEEFGSSQAFSVTASIEQKLTKEGEMARVFTYVEFSDGTTRSQTENVAVAVSSANPEFMEVDAGVSPPKITVPTGAGSECKDALDVTWSPCGTPIIPATTTGKVCLVMPPVKSIKLTYTDDGSVKKELVAPDDPLTKPPTSKKSEATLKTMVTFETGSPADYSTDSRVEYKVTVGNDKVEVVGNKVKVKSGVTAGGTDAATVTVSFTDSSGIVFVANIQPEDKKSSVTVDIDTLKDLDITASSFPICTGCDGRTTLKKIHSTDHYQRATLKLKITSMLASSPLFSGAPTGDFTMAVVGDTLELLDSSTKVKGVKEGSSGEVTATWGGKTAALQIDVKGDSDPARITGVTFTAPSGDAFVAEVDKTLEPQFELTFDDDTTFTVKSGSDSGVWDLKISSLLEFKSSDVAKDYLALDDDGTGVLTLKGNTPGAEYVDITATATAVSGGTGTPPSVKKQLQCNVEPGCNDVDFGAQSGGGPFAAAGGAGSTFKMDVRVNTCGEQLKGFQIVIICSSCESGSTDYPNNVMKVRCPGNGGYASASDNPVQKGSHWSTLPLEGTVCEINAQHEVQLVSAADGSTASGIVHIATIEFQLQNAGDSLMTGYVVETLKAGGTMGAKNRNIDAGTGTIVVGASGRRRRLRPQSLLRLGRPHPRRRRSRWLQSTSCEKCETRECMATSTTYVFGDANGDCSPSRFCRTLW